MDEGADTLPATCFISHAYADGLAADKFDRLVAAGYLVHTKAKTVADFYEVAPGFKASVRRFLTDGYPDGKLKKFIALLR